MERTDEELDRDWVPNGRRPQSTIARSFSAELQDIFKIENSVNDLDERLNMKKQEVDQRNNELETLQKRIRDMEARLKRNNGPNGEATAGQSAGNNTLGQPQEEALQRPKSRSRPGTAKQQQAPVQGGNMPPTPTASEGEYEIVDPHSSHLNSHGIDPETRSFTDYVVVSKDGDRDS